MLEKSKILVEELRNGEENAYAMLYEVFYESLVQYCHTLTQDLALAEDIVQNVFIKIWSNRKNLVITTSLKSYLYRSVFNDFAKEHHRRKRKEKALLEFKAHVLHQMVEMDRELLEKKIRLLDVAIEQLPKKCKKVFLLSKKQGYKYREIATQLDISEKAVEKHISRAIKRVKEIFEETPHIFMVFVQKLFAKR